MHFIIKISLANIKDTKNFYRYLLLLIFLGQKKTTTTTLFLKEQAIPLVNMLEFCRLRKRTSFIRFHEIHVIVLKLQIFNTRKVCSFKNVTLGPSASYDVALAIPLFQNQLNASSQLASREKI